MNVQELMKIKQMNYMRRLKTLEKTTDNETIAQCVIKPIKVKDLDKNRIHVNNDFDKAKRTMVKSKEDYYRQRTNAPYKNIIKDKKYYEQFISNPHKKINTDQLIVYKVQENDKDQKELENKASQFINKLEMHNDELNMLYSTNKKSKYKQEFEYNNKYKYRTYDPSSNTIGGQEHNERKHDKLQHYQREQQRMDAHRKQQDEVIETMIESGFLTEKDLQEQVPRQVPMQVSKQVPRQVPRYRTRVAGRRR